MAILAIFDHFWPYGHQTVYKNMDKWGFPEKNFENVAQQCLLDGCSTFLPDFIAKIKSLDHFPIEIPIEVQKNYGQWKEWL